MAYVADLTRTIVLKARRDTVVLIVTATAVTFALASAIHSRPSPSRAAPPQHWTGDLTDVTPTGSLPESGAPVTSASLVVPAADLALPPVPLRSLVKLRSCDGDICGSRAVPVRRSVSGTEAANLRRMSHHARPTLISRLNPLNHLPDMSTLSRPFAVAGNTVSGWFKRF